MAKFGRALRACLYRVRFGKLQLPCLLGKPLLLKGTKRVYIEKRCRFLAGERIETHEGGTIHIGANCSIGQNLHLVSGKGDLVIGHDVTISGNVFISNINHGYEDLAKSAMEEPLLYKETKIGSYCFLGYGAAILPGTVLGDHVIVGANAVTHGVYPSNCVIAGAPAKIIKIYDEATKQWIKP
jgi:acetyltransferase-like isoleucine patch superfamily enzyme